LMGEKEGTDLMYLTGYRSCHDKAIPIVADLLMREAELEKDNEMYKKWEKEYFSFKRAFEENGWTLRSALKLAKENFTLNEELSASQKRVEQLQEKLNFYYRTLQRRLTWEKVNIYHTLVI